MVMVKSEGKSAFLKEFFVDHPSAKRGEINDAWRAAGNQGQISSSLISAVRTDLGLKGKGRSKAKVKASVGASTGSSAASKSNGRRTGPEAGGRTRERAAGRPSPEVSERPAGSRAAGDDRTRLLTTLEGQIDEMLFEIKVAGGLPEFEEALRRARRVLARSHEG
jgi:hypothetical protein